MLNTTFILLISVALISPKMLSTISLTIVELNTTGLTFDGLASASVSNFFRFLLIRRAHISLDLNLLELVF